MVDAENESASRLARNSLDSVLDRLHEFRLRKENKGFSGNNISLQVNLNDVSKNYQDIINHYASKGLSSLVSYAESKKRIIKTMISISVDILFNYLFHYKFRL